MCTSVHLFRGSQCVCNVYVFVDQMLCAVLDSIVVSISACHAEDPGSIPGRGASFLDEPSFLKVWSTSIALLSINWLLVVWSSIV